MEENQDIVALLADESFQRWLSGKASDEENQQWKAWLSAAPPHHELYTEALKLWEMAHFRTAALPDIEQEWHTLHRRLYLQPAQTASIRSLSSRRTLFGQDRSTHFSWMSFGAIAAAAVLVIGLLWHYLPLGKQPLHDEMQVLSTNYGERTRIVLPDSTKIILNANSTLRYPAIWTATTPRRFELKGEAYFEVSSLPSGPQHDFVVYTSDGRVQVVGTRFVVYERNQGTRVVVEEGGVAITVADTTTLRAIPTAKILLKPEHLLEFQKGSRTLSPQAVNVGIYTTWWRDNLILENTPFEQVVRRLEETYGIQVKVKDKGLLQRTLSGSIENRNLDVITAALAKALRVSAHREGQVVVFGNSPVGR